MTCNPFLMHCDIFCATLATCSMHDVVTSSSSPLNDVLAMLQHLRQVPCNTFLIRFNIYLYVNCTTFLIHVSPRLTVTCQMFLIRSSIFFKWLATPSWCIVTSSARHFRHVPRMTLSHLLQVPWMMLLVFCNIFVKSLAIHSWYVATSSYL